MSAVSKSQFRFLKGVEHGSIKADGLSKKEAKEYTSENKSYKDLPEKVKFSKLKESFKSKKKEN